MKCKVCVNMTPHDVVINIGEKKITIPPSGEVLRLPEKILEDKPITLYDGTKIRVVRKILGTGELPESIPNICYIVSLPIAQIALRDDFFVPDDIVRDEKGKPIYAQRLAKIVKE